MESLIDEVRRIVEREMRNVRPSHDFSHVLRVYRLCLHLAEFESNVDLLVLRVAALLHDIARHREDLDSSGKIRHEVLGAEMAEKILRDLGFPESKIGEVKHCILAHRFRGKVKPETIEAKILSDADKLDVLGAVGIARAFMFAGEVGQKIYLDTPVDEYIKMNLAGGRWDGRVIDMKKHAPNLEFEVKFRRIPSMLYTRRAREIAEKRIKFMENYFRELEREIKGILD